jgi:hypothetical protein
MQDTERTISEDDMLKSQVFDDVMIQINFHVITKCGPSSSPRIHLR